MSKDGLLISKVDSYRHLKDSLQLLFNPLKNNKNEIPLYRQLIIIDMDTFDVFGSLEEDNETLSSLSFNMTGDNPL